jgi:hypothetical protein
MVTLLVEGPSGDGAHSAAFTVPVPSAPISQGLSLLLDSKPVPTFQALLPWSDWKPETTRSSSSHRKTMELWLQEAARSNPE